MEKRRNFSSFPQYFQYSPISGVRLHIHLLNVLFDLLFFSFPQTWYVEVRISRSVSESPLEFEINREATVAMFFVVVVVVWVFLFVFFCLFFLFVCFFFVFCFLFFMYYFNYPGYASDKPFIYVITTQPLDLSLLSLRFSFPFPLLSHFPIIYH